MKIIKFTLYPISVLLSILILDFFFGKFFLTNTETIYRIRNDVFHHTLKENYHSKKAYWANGFYEINTDSNGFKVSKRKKNRNLTHYDILIIGDSMAEGVGYEAEKTYYGYLEEKFPNLNIANMAVSSYSSQIYLSKLNYYYSNKFKFDHVILHYDISDLIDDYFNYDLNYEKKIALTKGKETNRQEIILNKLLKSFPLSYKIYRFLIKYDELNQIRENYIYNLPAGEYLYKDKDSFFNHNEKQIAFNKTQDLLLEIKKIVKKNKGKFTIMITPWPSTLKNYISDNIFEKKIEEFCKFNCDGYYNFFEDFLSLANEKGYEKITNEYFLGEFDDHHFSKKGHQFVSDLIYRQLKE